MSLKDVTDNINKSILHRHSTQGMDSLRVRINSLQLQLRNALRELRQLEQDGHDGLKEAALESLLRLFPGMRLSTDYDGLYVDWVKIPFVFHTCHTSRRYTHDVYQTLPLYSFNMKVQSSIVSLYNTTKIIFGSAETPGVLLNGINHEIYSHPHVSNCNSAAGDPFNTICYGNNQFTNMLGHRPLSPDDVIDFLRRAALWISRGNLNDCYDSPLYLQPEPDESLRAADNQNLARKIFAFCNASLRPLLREEGSVDSARLAALVEEFRRMCEDASTSLASALVNFASFLRGLAVNVDGTGADQTRLLLLANFCFTFWFYEVAATKLTILDGGAIRAAVLTDLDAFLSLKRSRVWIESPSLPLPAWRKAMLEIPLQLRSEVESADSMPDSARHDLLAQLPPA